MRGVEECVERELERGSQRRGGERERELQNREIKRKGNHVPVCERETDSERKWVMEKKREGGDEGLMTAQKGGEMVRSGQGKVRE